MARSVSKGSLAALIAVPLALAAGHLISAGDASYFMRHFRDTLHGPAFFAGTLIALYLAAKLAPKSNGMVWLIAGSLVVTAIAGELLQYVTGAYFTLADIAADVAGISLAFVFSSCLVRLKKLPDVGRRRWTTLLVVLTSCLVIAAPTWWLFVYYARENTFPTIANFSERTSRALLERTESDLKFSSDGPNSLELAVTQSLYPGFSIADPYPNWRGYNHLRFDAVSVDGATYVVALRIHDSEHNWERDDRFNGRFEVTPIRKTFCVSLDDLREAPTERDMNLEKIAEVRWFVHKAKGYERVGFNTVVLSNTQPENSCVMIRKR